MLSLKYVLGIKKSFSNRNEVNKKRMLHDD